MVISASRRTDIPAYYSKWFYNRIKEGYCTVPNPFNNKQISVVDLSTSEVDAIVFWTRNPKPILKYLKEFDSLGYKYYFHFTITNYPKIYEPFTLSIRSAIESFKKLSEQLGRGKVIWRYDPILFTDDLTFDFHIKNFQMLALELAGFTKRVVISIIDDYRKTLRRLSKLKTNYLPQQEENPKIESLLKKIVEIANRNKIEVQSCAEFKDYSNLGIKPGKCIDNDVLKDELGVNLTYKKDKTQRLACGCMISKDIGVNNTCLMGCEYCYATTSHQVAVKNRIKHDPNFPSIISHKIDDNILKKINDIKNNRGIEYNLFPFDF